MKNPFTKLTRPQQRLNLLRRFGNIRRETEQWLRDVESYDDILASRGEPPLDIDRTEPIRTLAWCDQQIAELRAKAEAE